jgi:hypothetical protein
MNYHYFTIEPKPNLQGKDYSSWQPNSLINKKIHVDAEIQSNWQYRQYIQKNANDIMKYNTMQTIQASGNNPYTILNTKPTQNTPYLYNSVHDTSNPYRNSDLKQDYTTKEQMKSRMISPSIPTNFR